MPLADLRLIFGMPQRQQGADARIVVIEVEIDGDPITIGVRADKVNEVTELAPSALTEAPHVGMRWRPEYIRFIGKRGNNFIVVPDIARVLSPTNIETSNGHRPPDQKPASLTLAGH